MSASERASSVEYDVVIVGAGISGINAAYRLQTELPSVIYTILESRGAIGGTWDLFRYPGIRSDSDLHTFGFPWRPWISPKSIADGTSIRNYVTESAAEYGIDRKVQFHQKLISANWSSEKQYWELLIDAGGEKLPLNARFLIMSTGYYDYETPLQTSIPGLKNFKGPVIHPQFWPEDLDYTGKSIIVIGSGATAVTLIPSLAEKAAKVTMLQRSPGYVVALPSVDPTGDIVRKIFPTWLAQRIVRLKFLVLPFVFFKFCRTFPNAGRKMIRSATKKLLPKSIPLDPNFNPSYSPWEQRLCICPDGDFFTSLRKGKADLVTGTIKTVTETGIILESGQDVETDIIVTATGLKMQLVGGARVSIDGKDVHVSEKFMWKGVMLQDIPNMALVIGYTNASWTLGAEATAQLVCRLLKHMERNHITAATPQVKDGVVMKPQPFLNLSSTYIEKAKGDLPQTGDRAPWLQRSNYLVDYWVSRYGSLTTGLQFTKSFTK